MHIKHADYWACPGTSVSVGLREMAPIFACKEAFLRFWCHDPGTTFWEIEHEIIVDRL